MGNTTKNVDLHGKNEHGGCEEYEAAQKHDAKMTNVQPTDEIDCTVPGIESIESADLAHLPCWYRIVRNAYGHEPLYFSTKNNTQRLAFIPSYIMKTFWGGSVITSMPFLDTGGPCGFDEAINQKLIDSLIRRANDIRVSYVEIRSCANLNLSVAPDLQKVTLTLPLTGDADLMWQHLSAKVRNQVRKAEKSDLTFKHVGLDRLRDFYRIWAMNMRDLGSPPHSLKFFEETFKAFGENAHLHLVYKEAKPIGGLIGLSYGDTFAVPWASSLREYFKLCPNMLLYWETIKRACELGYKTFDFGRSGRNQGTYHFKKQWGAEEKQLYWYTIPIKSKVVKKLSGNDSAGKLLTSLWKHLPLAVTIWLGPKIRKYLTQ